MLIGISGKISSGKDTVGKIIQYLIAKQTGRFNSSLWSKEALLGEHIGANAYLELISDWEIKKFADKLKDIVCL